MYIDMGGTYMLLMELNWIIKNSKCNSHQWKAVMYIEWFGNIVITIQFHDVNKSKRMRRISI